MLLLDSSEVLESCMSGAILEIISEQLHSCGFGSDFTLQVNRFIFFPLQSSLAFVFKQEQIKF